MPVNNQFKNIILALDNEQQVQSLLNHNLTPIKQNFDWVKIGMELFYSQGRNLVEKIHQQGFKIFLDLKLYDIPQTVFNAIKIIGQMPVHMTNIHISGGKDMMIAAQDCLNAHPPLIKEFQLIGVSVLTSLSEKTWQESYDKTSSLVSFLQHQVRLANQCQLDGVVCSAQDIHYFQDISVKPDWIYVTPGIRLDLSQTHDQIRVCTPKQAFNQGSHFLVMGREITLANNIDEIIVKLHNHLNQDGLRP